MKFQGVGEGSQLRPNTYPCTKPVLNLPRRVVKMRVHLLLDQGLFLVGLAHKDFFFSDRSHASLE